ncbi:heterokaryon incompatibility protein-domain-containing protein [Scleroderma yunnanense]
MHLINVKALLRWETLVRREEKVDHRIRMLEFRDDESRNYAILSHRWTLEEVSFEEMIDLAKMNRKERDEIRQRDGYRKLLNSCEQAKRDGYEWLWVDTCCIDKRSSAELSEAINSMYRWYENSRVCYTYLCDVPDSSFPTRSDDARYPRSNGWPEWFSRGWTLQDMIASSNVLFFNKDWQFIGDKRTLAPILEDITRVPQKILREGLSSNRPCFAQIMSWATNRRTTRVEDKAYSLMGLLGINMPLLYGEGKKAFHRLQLEFMRMSTDQSVFAWGFNGRHGRSGSILADDPTFFQDCNEVELIDRDEFIQDLETEYLLEENLRSTEDRFGVFPITNRGIQIWMYLRPCAGFTSVFEAFLPCRKGSSGPPLSINLALWKSDYYRRTLQFRQLYLRYQDTPYCDAIFEIDASDIIESGFTCCDTNPPTLTSTNPLCVQVYSDPHADCRFASWIHVTYDESGTSGGSWDDYAKNTYTEMLAKGVEHVRSMPDTEAHSRGEHYGRVYIMQIHLPRPTWTVQISTYGIRVDVFRYSGAGNISSRWKGFDVDDINEFSCDMRGLMICDNLSVQNQHELLIDGVPMEFLLAPSDIKLGDYGHLTDSMNFHCEGNIFVDPKYISSKPYIIPKEHERRGKDGYVSDSNYVKSRGTLANTDVTLDKPLCLSLPSNHDFNSLLTSLSARLTNRYLVTRVIQCATHLIVGLASITDPTTLLYTIAKPLVWHQDESTHSACDGATHFGTG